MTMSKFSKYSTILSFCLDYTTCIQIGFLNDKQNERMVEYLENFDIVILGDTDMNLIQDILNSIRDKKTVSITA
jgi:hypothetical protein